jgi:hypothetical protein
VKNSVRTFLWRIAISLFPHAMRGKPSCHNRFQELSSRSAHLARARFLQNRLNTGNGGGSGIRTHGHLRVSGFQDRRIRPLCHPSCQMTFAEIRAGVNARESRSSVLTWKSRHMEEGREDKVLLAFAASCSPNSDYDEWQGGKVRLLGRIFIFSAFHYETMDYDNFGGRRCRD